VLMLMVLLHEQSGTLICYALSRDVVCKSLVACEIEAGHGCCSVVHGYAGDLADIYR
jgi:hypothetical protein